MAKAINAKHIWHKPRVRFRGAYIEVDERKPLETACLIIFPLIALVGFGVLPFATLATTPLLLGAGIAAGLIATVISVIIAVVYRPPRVLRLYPLEGLAYCYRRGLHFKPFARWYDLQEAPFEVEQRYARGEKIESTGQIALGCLGLLFGPLGLLALLIGPKEYEQVKVYCLVHPSKGSVPIAVFQQHADVKQVAEFYQAAEQSV